MAQGIFWILLRRLLAWLHASSGSIISLALTLAFFTWLRWRNNNNNSNSANASDRARASASSPPTSNRRLQQEAALSQEQQAGPSSSSPWLSAPASAAPSQQPAEPWTGSAATAAPPSNKLQARLQGLRRVTVSVPGTVLEERQLEDSATVQGGQTVAALREVLQAADVYLIAHVADDIGQAVVTGALEAANLLGLSPTQLPPQRLLFCSTQTGKQSMVRQIEPELHIDGDATTLEDLRRFVPRLLWVGGEGGEEGPGCAEHARSLGEYFGV